MPRSDPVAAGGVGLAPDSRRLLTRQGNHQTPENIREHVIRPRTGTRTSCSSGRSGTAIVALESLSSGADGFETAPTRCNGLHSGDTAPGPANGTLTARITRDTLTDMTMVSIRDLRNKGGEVVDRAARGEAITITKAGEPVAELRALTKGGPAPEVLLGRWRALPRLDPRALRADIDTLLDARL